MIELIFVPREVLDPAGATAIVLPYGASLISSLLSSVCSWGLREVGLTLEQGLPMEKLAA